MLALHVASQSSPNGAVLALWLRPESSRCGFLSNLFLESDAHVSRAGFAVKFTLQALDFNLVLAASVQGGSPKLYNLQIPRKIKIHPYLRAALLFQTLNSV